MVSHHHADILKVHHEDSTTRQFTAEVSDKLNVKVKHGFGAWLKSRREDDDTSNDRRNPGSEQPYDRVQHENSSLSSTQHSCKSNPLSPEQFDSLADSIASRVKQDLGIRNDTKPHSLLNHVGAHSGQEHMHHAGEGHHDYERRAPAAEGVARGRTFVHHSPQGQSQENGEVDVSSHCCAFCSVLMVSMWSSLLDNYIFIFGTH
jgi:hypothetical protein